jgi:hypothetical protein
VCILTEVLKFRAGRSGAGTAGSKPTRGMNVYLRSFCVVVLRRAHNQPKKIYNYRNSFEYEEVRERNLPGLKLKKKEKNVAIIKSLP